MGCPRLITARELDLSFANLFGELGPETFVTGHHTAGPKDDTVRRAIELARIYHRDHASKGWGGIGYHFMLVRHQDVIICLRPTRLKGAHVGGHNSNNIGVVCNGTVGDRPTLNQMNNFRWLLAHAHTKQMPRAHRTDRDLRGARLLGHNDWSGHEWNACPGDHKRMYVSGGRRR